MREIAPRPTRGRANIQRAFRRDYAEARESLRYLRCIFRATHRNCIFGKRNFIGGLGHVERRNCTPGGKRIRRVTNGPEPKIFTSH